MTARRYSELFVFYRDGHPVHIHSDRTVFERWMSEAAWQYPPDRCEIERFVPAPSAPPPHSQASEVVEASPFSDEEIRDGRWAVNVLLEKIAAKFEANDTWDIWKSDAAALVRSFKHDLPLSRQAPQPAAAMPSGDLTDAEDLLLEIANSMSKDFADPAEHANWCVEETKKYFSERPAVPSAQGKS